MSDLIREINEELRQERLINLWKKYQFHIYALIAIIISITIAYVVISNKSFDSQNSDSKVYFSGTTALNNNNIEFAEEKFSQLSDSKNIGYKILSLLRLAAMSAQDNNYNNAKNYYDQIINLKISKKFKNLNDLAEFNNIKIKFNNNESADIKYNKENSFLPLLEELEIITDINNKNFTEANKKIDKLMLNNDLPVNLQNRINMLKSKIPNDKINYDQK